MCGIIGIISKVSSNQLEINPEVLSHRGPDSLGKWNDEDHRITLGHTRLSIIDLSDEAKQPLHSLDGRYVIVFNGEIYNYRELVKKLKIAEKNTTSRDEESVSAQFGYQLRTKSDTEVLLECFKKWGKNCLKELNGMFAFAIYDRLKKKLFLARDAMGIKPLFYFKDENHFVFASEIKAIKKIKGIRSRLTIDQNAIADFLQLGYIPGSRSIFNEIRKVPQGHYAEIYQGSQIDFLPWWELDEQVEVETYSKKKSAANHLERLLENSVRSRLVADVTVGSFLSGGTDSSLVSSIANKFTEKPLKTFTIGFENKQFDESAYASKVAKAIGSDHSEWILNEKMAMDILPEILPTYDEPFADSSAIPTMLVSGLARKDVKVVLTGDGGDELFHGYGTYAWADRLGTRAKRSLAQVTSGAMRRFGNSRVKRIGELMNTNRSEIRSHIFSQEQYFFSEQEIENLLVDPVKGDILDYADPNLSRQLTDAENQAFFDLKYYLPDDLLVKVDRATMKYGLEARVPLLDKKLIRFALNVDPHLKRKEKYLLKQVLYKHLPEPLFDRPKWGFGVPLGKWLIGDLSWLIDTYLQKDVVEETGFVRFSKVAIYISRFRNGESYLYNRIWALILLHWWCKSNLD